MAVPTVGMAQDAGWYVGGSIGQSMWDVDCTGASCDDKDTTFRIFGGYMFNKNFGVELGYADLGSLRVSGSVPPFGTVTADVEATAFDLVAVGVLPISNNFSIYGKAGLYMADSELNGTVTGLGSASTSDSNTDLTIGFGVQYNFNKNLGVQGEFRRYMKVGSDDTGGDGDIDVISVGVVYRF